MRIKLVLAGLVAVLAGLAWWTWSNGGGAGGELVPDRAAAPLSPGGETALEPIARPADVEERAELAPSAPDAGVAAALEDEEDPWAEELGGVVGRVVEEDLTPVPGISVALIQADANLLVAVDWQALGEKSPDLILERTHTDDEGRFRLDGAYDASFHGLGIDLRGPRSTVRVVEQQVHGREVVDLGDIVLAAGCIVTGRVVDESGSPVAGARVRIGPAPPQGIDEALPLELQDFRADCAVGISMYVHDGDTSPVVEPPPIVRRHLDDFPFPTTWTDDEGRFRFEGAPIGGLLIAADLRGWLGELRRDDTEPGENELPDLVLRAGRTIRGEVFDMSGDPLAGVEVMAGTELMGAAAILQPAGLTDADGRFSVTGCPPDGNMMACARRRPGEPWIGVIGTSVDEMELEFEDVFQVTVRVVDATGQPVSDANVALSPTFESGSPMHIARRFGSFGAEPRPSRFSEVEPGVYSSQDVTPGLYEISARPKDLCLATKTLELWPGVEDVVLVCEPGRVLEVTVTDAATGKRVPAARASILNTEVDLFSAVAVARTDRQGVARLGPFNGRVFDWEDGEWRDSQRPQTLLVQHPRYADTTLEVHDGTFVAQVDLVRGGEVLGEIRWGANPPARLYMVMLEPRDTRGDVQEAFMPPRIGRSGLDGTFRFTNLRAGTWRLDVYERWLEQDPLTLMMEQRGPVLVHRHEDLVVEPGLSVPVVVDLSPDGGGQTARLAGVVRLDGRPYEGAEVRVYSPGAGGRATTGPDGSYETTPFLCSGKDMRVSVRAEIDGVRSVLHEGPITPAVGSVYRLDVDTGSSTLFLRAVSAETGEPVAGARVAVNLEGGGRTTNAKTDDAGEALVTLVGAGRATVTVKADGHSAFTRELEVSAGVPTSPEIFELPGTIPCAGVCDLTSIDYASIERAFVLVQGGSFREFERLDMDDLHADGVAPFESTGIGPGDYTARFWIDGDLSGEVEFTLPPEGDANLVLRHPGESAEEE